MPKKDLIVKDNTLINASYTLSLVEQRIVLLAISQIKQGSLNITPSDYVNISVSNYLERFGLSLTSAYTTLKESTKQLFERKFSYTTAKGSVVMSRWVSTAKYNDQEGTISIIFAPELIPFIQHLEKRFTSYFLEDVAKMTSVYAIRLYELIIAWRSTHKTPVFELDDFKGKLGVEPTEYPRLFDFKKRVLDIAVNQINEHSNIKIKVEQHKKGRKISGFSFSFVENQHKRDEKTIDWINGKEDSETKKREKITMNDLVRRHSDKTYGKSRQEVIEMFKNQYYIMG